MTEWRKSSRSNSSGDECVEVAGLGENIGVRDSKNPHGPTLTFDPTAWHAFTHRIKSSEQDLN
jgi:hypothetical protein